MTGKAAVILDVDGTLIDSNDAHAQAWVSAFAEEGITVAFDDVRRGVGMGGDKLMPMVSGIEEDTEQGQRISATPRGHLPGAPSPQSAADARNARPDRAAARRRVRARRRQLRERR